MGSPVHRHSVVHPTPLAVCMHTRLTHQLQGQLYTKPQTLHTTHHTRVQWTMLWVLLFTSHHSRPLTVHTVHLLLQPFQGPHGSPWDDHGPKAHSGDSATVNVHVRVCVHMCGMQGQKQQYHNVHNTQRVHCSGWDGSPIYEATCPTIQQNKIRR